MNSQTYVSDPRLWEAFYKNMAEKKFNPYKYKPKQMGRGMRKYKPYVIPLRPHSQLESVRNTTQVTPVAAVEERAKMEHAKDVKEGVPFVKVLNSIKRKHSQSSVIPSKKAKTSTSPTRRRSKKKKNSSKPVKPKKSSNQTKRKPVKKQQKVSSKKPKTKKVFKIDSYKSIFKH